MPPIHTSSCRRRFLGLLGLGGVFVNVPGAFAQALVETPRQTVSWAGFATSAHANP